MPVFHKGVVAHQKTTYTISSKHRGTNHKPIKQQGVSTKLQSLSPSGFVGAKKTNTVAI